MNSIYLVPLCTLGIKSDQYQVLNSLRMYLGLLVLFSASMNISVTGVNVRVIRNFYQAKTTIFHVSMR